jgi:peptidoglycan/xylan/chitin deacetylase (PgdA/CDA1 family)
MLLKRSIVLAASVLLFIVAFIIYFEVSHVQMENRFRAEREKFHVDHLVLTASASRPAPTTAAPTAAPAPASSPSDASDTNTPISPVPPPSSSTPDSAPVPSTTPTPAAPDTNSAPTMPSPSTMNYRRENHSPFFVLASYRPSDGAAIQVVDMVAGQVTAPAAAPATNSAPAPGGEINLYNAKPATTSGGTTRAAGKTSPAPTGATNSAPASSPATKTAPAASTPVETSALPPATGEASVIILGYHQFRAAGASSKNPYNMPQDVFESEMKYIKDNGYHVVPLSEVVRFVKHEITLPPGSVAVTIDDGYKSAIVYAAPILKKYGYPWTFFVYPDFITVGEGPGAASWNDLVALQAEGVDIESHSMTHPFLTHHHQQIKHVWHDLSPEEYDQFLTTETAGSKAILEQKLGKSVTCLAYPYGDYNKQVEAKAIAAGYEAIFTVADNPVHSTTNIHSIGRYIITQPVERDFPAYLHQSALSLAKADPEPGATISEPRPVITAVLAEMGAGKIDPNSLETSVRDYGVVRHDFDPQTNTVRLYLSRDLIQPVVLVNLRAKDAATGQVMVANWHFNYEPDAAASTPVHTPIAPATNAPAASSKKAAPASSNAPTATEPAPSEKSAAGAPLDAHPAPAVSPH